MTNTTEICKISDIVSFRSFIQKNDLPVNPSPQLILAGKIIDANDDARTTVAQDQ